MTSDERERFAAFEEIKEQCMLALSRGEKSVTMSLDPLTWIAIIQEVKDRYPRNYSRLLREDQFERLDAAIERLHDNANFLISHHPAPVASRFDPIREHQRRSAVGAELQRHLKGEK